MKYITTVDDQDFNIEILDEHDIVVNDKAYSVDFESVSGQPVFSLIVNGESYEAYIYEDDGNWEVLLRGTLYPATVVDEREQRLRSAFGGRPAQSSEFYLKSPMPGLVFKVLVKDGDKIEEGDVLVILESMKMQNELKSPRDGVVSRVRVADGDNVDRKETLLSVV
ncbi:MAG: biotin/lipoyl-containing protein [Chloroflexota bacterium]|nr:biotin/lipoyl-containing protein [Chloroflexota bacterium]